MVNRKESIPVIYMGNLHKGRGEKYPDVAKGERGWLYRSEFSEEPKFYPRSWGGLYCFSISENDWQHDDTPSKKKQPKSLVDYILDKELE